jgi:RES domain-containing protein
VPLTPPPAKYHGTPNRYVLTRGTCLWRIHNRTRPARNFRSMPSGVLFDGARFDSTDLDPYPFWYAALGETTAVAEVLLRDLHPDERGTRALTRRAVSDRKLSGLTLTRNLDLVSLIDGQDLAAVAQDAWLVTASAHEYAQTRAWAHWLRGQAPWAHGFIWSSLRDRGGMAIILFGDRCAATFGARYEESLLHEVPELAVDLGDKAGADWLNSLLEPWRVTVEVPSAHVSGPVSR